MIAAYGVYWTGEGMGIDWPGHDVALVAIAIGLLATALLGVRIAMQPIRTSGTEVAP